MSYPNYPTQQQYDARYSKPSDVAQAISTQATADAGQYASRTLVGKNPLDYGCKFDGVTDDRSALTTFFAGLGSRDIVHFPTNKTAYVSAVVNTGTSWTNGKLYGNNATIKLAPSATAGAIVMQIQGAGITVRDVIIDGSDVASGTGIRPLANDCVIENCYFIACRTGGVYVVGSPSGIRFQGNRVEGNGYGFLVQDSSTASYIEVLDNSFYGDRQNPSSRALSGDAIEINTPTGKATHVTISRNQIHNYGGTLSSGIGIGAAHVDYLTIDSNTITNTLGIGTANDAIHVEDASHFVKIRGNTSVGIGAGWGINVLETVGGQSSDNELTSDVEISGNICIGNAFGGIAVQGSGGIKARKYRIQNNHVTGNGTAASSAYNAGILLGYQTYDSICSDNHITNTLGNATSTGISCATNTWIMERNLTGDTQATKTQQYGITIFSQNSPVYNNVELGNGAGNASALYRRGNGSASLNDPNAKKVYAFTDTFSRADQSPNLGLSSDFSQSWTASAAWSINSGHAKGVPTSSVNSTLISTTKSDCIVQATILTPGDGGLMGRMQDASNGWVVRVGVAGYWSLNKLVAGSLGTALLFVVGGPTAGDVIQLAFSGSSIKLMANGIQVGTTITDTTYQTATSHGLYQSGGTAAVWDDFSVL